MTARSKHKFRQVNDKYKDNKRELNNMNLNSIHHHHHHTD
jgi:hypothetical protein